MGDVDIWTIVMNLSCFIIAGSIHEFAHAFSAARLGDDTARLQKRLSVNPLYHVDLIGTIVLPIISILSNLPLLGWMRPVPINVLKLQSKRGIREALAIVSFAGPYSNLLQALFSFLALKLLFYFAPVNPHPIYVASILFVQSYCSINMILMFFNLLPLPPLDGGAIAVYLLSAIVKDYSKKTKIEDAFESIRKYGIIILYLLAFSGFLARFLRYGVNAIFKFLNMINIPIMVLFFTVALIPLLIFILTYKRSTYFSNNEKIVLSSKKNHTSKIKRGDNLFSQSCNTVNGQQARALYHRLSSGQPFNEKEDSIIIKNYKNELSPSTVGQCSEQDFNESDNYCKKCELFGHCLLRAIDKIIKFQ